MTFWEIIGALIVALLIWKLWPFILMGIIVLISGIIILIEQVVKCIFKKRLNEMEDDKDGDEG